MTNFYEVTPTLDNYWCSIVLFGRNVASYEFALAVSFGIFCMGKPAFSGVENSGHLFSVEPLLLLDYITVRE